MTSTLDLAGLLTIWPIAESFAVQTPVGDLITLARSSSTLRSSLHGRIPENDRPEHLQPSRRTHALDPELGKHQTIDWGHLKAIAPFVCSSRTHTRGQRTNPCVYCSKPICDACIVRDSFKHRNENTFKNRLRYYCRDCWSEGRPNRKFRYPAVEIDDDGFVLKTLSSTRHEEDASNEVNKYCECNLKDDGWLCLECKDEQNSSPSAPWKLLSDPDPKTHWIQCYGHDCDTIVDLDSPEKDRRRVCLWCEKPVRRQYGGEDRHVWNMKTIEARARNAESRSRDLEEYNRKRSKVLRMSRQEMRGTLGPDDDQPVFVRHLDTINYRNWMAQDSAPDPEAVWKSKNGYWRYQRGFFFAVQRRCRFVEFTVIGGISVEKVSRLTREGGSAHVRLNRDLHPEYRGYGLPRIPDPGQLGRVRACMNELKTRIIDLYLIHGQNVEQIDSILIQQYGIQGSTSVLIRRQLGKWLEGVKPQSVSTMDPDLPHTPINSSPSIVQEQENTSMSVESRDVVDDTAPSLIDAQLGEVVPNEDPVLLELDPPSIEAATTAAITSVPTQDQNTDEPPPYMP